MVLTCQQRGCDISQNPSRSRGLLWFVLALGFLDGAIFNFLPVTFPVFVRQFGSTLEQLGRLQLVFFLSTLAFSVFGGALIGRLGLARAGAAVLALLVAAFVTIAGAPGFPVLLLGGVGFGVGLSGIEVVSNAMISDNFPERRQSIFFVWGIINAVGATLGPAALGRWLRYAETARHGWRAAYLGVAIPIAVLALLALSIPAARRSAGEGQQAGPALLQVLRKPVIYGIGCMILLHGLAQVGMVSWVGRLFAQRFGIDTAQAAYFISLNSAGFFVGRSLLGWITARWRIRELVLLTACAGGGTLAYVATIAAPGYAWGLAMFAVAGMFISGDGPSVNSYLGLRFAGQSATAFAVMNGMGNLGAAAGPYLVGSIGNRFGLETGIWFLPAFSFGLSLLAFTWSRVEKRRAAGSAAPRPSIASRT